jgi:galactokinase
MNESHWSSSYLLESSNPQLDQMVELSLKYGALGARITDGGWLLALVPNQFVDGFIKGLEVDYFNRFSAEIQEKCKEDFIFAAFPRCGVQMYYL